LSPKRARCPGASAAVLLLALALAGAARAASYTARPEIDVEETYDDNVLSEEDEIASWNTRIAPAISLTRKTDLTDASLLLGLTRREIHHIPELDGTDERVSANVRRILTRRLSVAAHANYQFYAAYDTVLDQNPSGTTDVLSSERPELTWQGVSGEFTYVLTDVTSLIGEIEWNRSDYGHAQQVRSDLFDDEVRSVSLTLNRQFTPIDKIGAAIAYGITEEDSSEPFPITGTEIHTEDTLGTLVGFWERTWSARWVTSVRGGVRTLDSDFQADRLRVFEPVPDCLFFICLDNVENSNSGTGLIGGATISNAYSHNGQVSLSYSRDTRTGTSSSTGSSSVDADTFELTLTHKLSSRVTFSAHASYISYRTTDESIDANRDESTRWRPAEVRLDWLVRKNLTAYARYNYVDVNQDRTFAASDRAYQRRIYGVGLRYFFDREL
jgi:hypothetical protein